MATVPSIEAHLVQLHKCLRLPAQERLKTEDRRGFSDLGLTLDKHQRLAHHFMGEILASIDVGAEATTFVLDHFLDWATFYKAVQLHTWTGRASFKQVVWHLAANVHAPSLGRYLAFWAMDGALGQGMPGGHFWFLPTIGAPGRPVQEPVPKVLDWLLDLYGAPAARLSEVLGEGTAAPRDKADSFARNLSNWRKDSLYARTIQEMFSDDFDRNTELHFRGTFELDRSLPVLEQAAAARDFVQAKGLSPEILRDEIPMTAPGRIEAVLEGEARPEEIERFLDLLRNRYGRPSARVIRRRLQIALMCQQAYRDLCSLFGVKHDDSDLSRNKVLQLTAILSRSYNVTVEARNAAADEGEEAENRYFEGRLFPWEALGQFMGVLPSRKGRAAPDVGSHLTRIFLGLDPQSELGDLIPRTPEQLESFARAAKAELEKELEEIDRYAALKERVQRSSPWRALQGESWFSAVQRLASDSEISDHARIGAARRLRELASNPDEFLQAILCELHALLDVPSNCRPQDVASLVAALLEQAQASAAVLDWQAPLLAFEAKHLLAQNRWPEASTKFRAALDASSIASFGPLRGEIARDAWSLALAMDRLHADQEKFYRNMLDYGAIEGEAAEVTMEDVALQVADIFWDDLYKPYPRVPRKPPTARVQAGAALKDAVAHIAARNWDGLHSWFKTNRTLHRAHLKDVRGDTVLTLWLKMRSDESLPAEFRANLLLAIEMLVEAWPAQANLADFKSQTSLMLAADAGLERVVAGVLRCPQVNVDAQDYLGRTALHAAVTGNSKECVRLLLNRQPDMLRVTYGEGQTALHTAARMGCIEIAAMIKEEFPFLVDRKNVDDRTPAEECKDSLQSYDVFAEALAAHGRVPPSPDALRSTYAMLTASV
jgi:hypothetical protein